MKKVSSLFLTFITVLFLLTFVARAQDTKLNADPTQEVNKDDILILVNLTAKELKFDAVPNPTVEFPGTKDRSKIWITQRQNLPDQVQPGVTYRNIGIQLKISSRFQDIERIVQEALGEAPINDYPSRPSSALPSAVPLDSKTQTKPVDRVKSGRPFASQRRR